MIFNQKEQFILPQDIFNMRHLLILISFLFALNGIGQVKAKIADDHFDHMEYALCVEMYDELAMKFLQQKDKTEANWNYVRRAAISHYYLFEMNAAEVYFKRLKEANKLTENDREFYVRSLLYLGKYEDCKSLIHESATLYQKNAYFARLNSKQNELHLLWEDSLRYIVKESTVNSGEGDFAPCFSDKGIIFATKSVNTKAIHTSYGWDNAYYINLMEAEITQDTLIGSPKLLRNEFLSKAHDGPVSFNSTGDQMVITRNNIQEKNGKEVVVLSLYFSSKINGEWTELKPFPYNNPNYNVGHAVFAENDKAIYFVSDQPGGYGAEDIYVCRLNSTNSWSEPINLGPTINTEQSEVFPFVFNNKIYFASNGHFGLGGLDIFEKDLQSGIPPVNIGYPINTSHDDFGMIIDKSGLRGYLSSNRTNNIDRIYSFLKKPINISLSGIVYAKYRENEPIANQSVFIVNKSNGHVDTVFSNEFGQFTGNISLNEEYRIYTSKEEFELIQESTITCVGIKKDTTFYVELALKPTTILIHLRVVEARTGKIIPNALTSVTDYSINKDTTMMTNDQGMVTMKVDRNKSYWAHASKKGYLDDNVAFNSANENDKVIDLELRLPPIVKGDKFKLENIFYDLNKSTLRPESMLALDKLAAFIIENDLKIELSAHTDARGSDVYNQKLSQARAQSCVDYLISKGVKRSSIIAKGYGETQLLNKCKNNVTCPEEMHQENRRTEVKIL